MGYAFKIYFKTDFEGNLIIRFNPNFDPQDRKSERHSIAEKAGEEFVKTAMQYLNSQ